MVGENSKLKGMQKKQLKRKEWTRSHKEKMLVVVNKNENSNGNVAGVL